MQAEQGEGKADITDLFVQPLTLRLGTLLDEWWFGQHDTEGEGPVKLAELSAPLARQYGILLPDMHVTSAEDMAPYEYALDIRGFEVVRGRIRPGMILVCATANEGDAEMRDKLMTLLSLAQGQHEGANDPVSGAPAIWIKQDMRTDVKRMGYRSETPQSVLASHLKHTLLAHPADLLSRTLTGDLLDRYRTVDDSLIRDLLDPARGVPLSLIYRVLQELLAERVPVHDITTIAETLLDISAASTSLEAKIERVRAALAGTISRQYIGEVGKIWAIVLDEKYRRKFAQALRVTSDGEAHFNLTAADFTALLDNLDKIYTRYRSQNNLRQPVLLVDAGIRRPLARLLHQTLSHIAVLSPSEIRPEAPVEMIARIESE